MLAITSIPQSPDIPKYLLTSVTYTNEKTLQRFYYQALSLSEINALNLKGNIAFRMYQHGLQRKYLKSLLNRSVSPIHSNNSFISLKYYALEE